MIMNRDGDVLPLKAKVVMLGREPGWLQKETMKLIPFKLKNDVQ